MSASVGPQAAAAVAAAVQATGAAAPVVDDVAKAAAPLADDVAKAAAPLADDAAKVVVTAARSGVSGTWLGLGAGAAGVAITLLDAWKQSMGTGRGITSDALVNPTTITIGGGAALLAVGEKVAVTSPVMRNGLRTAGAALVLGGIVGAIIGVVNTFGNPLRRETDAATSSQSQAPVRFGTALPPAPANLSGVEVASAEVIGEGAVRRVPVYVDPRSATALPGVTSLGEAIGHARAAAQGDESFRSHAVVQTLDGAYWVMRLSGELDQVDGPKYSDGTKYDSRYEPQIGRRQQAVQAIAGVEGHYAFPEGMEATAPVQYTGEIPWVTPPVTAPKPTTPKPAEPKPTEPAAPAGS